MLINIVLVVLAALSTYTVDALYCLSCTAVVSPRHCHTLQKCEDGNICFTQRYSEINGEVLFDTGCSTPSICSKKRTLLGMLKSHNPAYGHRERCVECCSSDACNHKGCGALDYPSVRGPLCFSCPQSLHPAFCSSVKVCNENEICHLHEEIEFGESYFVSSCSKRNICDRGSPAIFGKRSSERCFICCDSDLCNKDCGNQTLITTIKSTLPTLTTTSTPTSTMKYNNPFDCWEVLHNGFNRSGIYQIYPWGSTNKSVSVHCNMDVTPGGWTEFQRRENLTVNFTRGWEDYKNGFGTNAEFWLGNEIIHLLSSIHRNQLYIGIGNVNGNYWYEKYHYVRIGPESNKYRLHIEGPATGSAGDHILRYNDNGSINDQPFTTFDSHNDKSPGNCAITYSGGWWFNYCYHIALNNRPAKQGVVYPDRIPNMKSLKSSTMMITRG